MFEHAFPNVINMQPPTASPETLLISHRQHYRAQRKDACFPRTYTFRDATLLLSRATKPVRGSALFTEKISRAVVNKLVENLKPTALSMWRTACKSRGKHFPDNSPAITRSLKTPSINPPARHATQQHRASLGQDAGPQRPTLT